MRSLTLISVVLLVMLWVPSAAVAEPAWGGNCLSCHGQLQVDTLFIFGEDTTADPDESGTGAPDRGTLPVFQACRGGTKSLLAEVAGLDTNDTYAVQLTRLRFPGVVNGSALEYTGDCGWPEWGEDANYYSDPVIRHCWGSGPTTFTFNIDVEPDTPDDYYDLVFAVAGKFQDGSGLFYAEQHFYLQVSIPGDMNQNGYVDFGDLDLFIDVLLGLDPGGLGSADVNCDGQRDGRDIQLFVNAFLGRRRAAALPSPFDPIVCCHERLLRPTPIADSSLSSQWSARAWCQRQGLGAPRRLTRAGARHVHAVSQ